MQIIVSPLSLFHETIRQRKPHRIISLLSPEAEFPAHPDYGHDHLKIPVNDIVEDKPGFLAPQRRHVETILGFVETWDRRKPLFIHCWAGISRSTATALIAAAYTNPDASEEQIAQTMRHASPTAQPNARLIAFADDLLGRNGRLMSAVAGMGEAIIAVEAVPFVIPAHFCAQS